MFSFRSTSGKSSKSGMETAGLNEFAKHALKEICSQDWVREKFLKDLQGLFTPDMLLDSVLAHNQVSTRRKHYSFQLIVQTVKEGSHWSLKWLKVLAKFIVFVTFKSVLCYVYIMC